MVATELDELLSLVRAPAFVLSEKDGQIRPGGVAGSYVDDRRVLSTLHLRIDGHDPAYADHELTASDVAVLRLGVPDLAVQRTRRVLVDGLEETLELTSQAPVEVRVRLELELAADDADIAEVRAGRTGRGVSASTEDGAVVFAGDATVRVTLSGDGVEPDALAARDVGVLGAHLVLQPLRSATVTVRVRVEDRREQVVAAPRPLPPWSGLEVVGTGPLARLVERSLEDLDVLRLGDAVAPDDEFFAAGAPWYLTLFGRDSLWAARMSLALGTDVAAGTLRALARRQGRVEDVDSAQEPGKILHEVRREATTHLQGGADGSGMLLPAVYYGTEDATSLWVLLLHDAWLWGMDPDSVEQLLPHLEAALARDRRAAARDVRGFLAYRDVSGHGLANQGWKDSPSAVQFADGRLAEGPVALAEVQAYAFEAALAGARLLDAFDRPGGEECRGFARGLAERFRAHFWVGDDSGRYPAIALDRDGTPVDTVTSNIGHLLGTGLLSAEEEKAAAERLVDLSSGYGLRTLAEDAEGFDPLSYHCGSVWTHDTAIAIWGLVRSGASPAALGALVDGLLAAAPHFGFQMPELHGGQAASVGPPVPYPRACRPQAWSAAAGVVLATTLAGVRPDVPAGTVTVAPPAHASAALPLHVRGLRVGHDVLEVEVAADGTARATLTGASTLRVVRA